MRDWFARPWIQLRHWWLELDSYERRHASLLTLFMAAYLGHYLLFSVYFIEDAGISYAYARNLVNGEGLTPFPGGERVEGYSNPLWTFLIAFFYALKVPVWTSAKVMGAVFGAITLPLAYLVTRACRPQRDHVALIPPFFLALSTTFVVWNASGLENSLFNVLLAAGIYRVIRESADPSRRPLSAVFFLLLALTRPEGILYAALGGFFRLLLPSPKTPIFRPILGWLAVFFVPFLLYHLWRYTYFAWEWPNTYYAKMDGENRFRPWKFNSRGWLYVQKFMRAYWLAYVLPLFVVGLVGLKGRRRWVVVALTGLGAVILLWNGKPTVFGLERADIPTWWSQIESHWDKIRVGFLLGSVVVCALATLRFRGGLERLLVLSMGVVAIFFILISGGDWMKQWRWFNMVAFPLFIVLGLGVGEMASVLGETRGRPWRPSPTVVAWGLAVILVVPNTWNSAWSAPSPETTVSDVQRRVAYMQGIQRQLHLDRVTLLDVDMGAHLWYSDWRIVDIAGLVDVPMARHLYQKKFMLEHVFEENSPEFAHVHGGWANRTRIPRLPNWREDYIEIPGYPSGRRSFHVGNHVRRDLFIRDSYEGPEGRSVDFDGGIALEGWRIPSPAVVRGGKLYLETWLRAGFRQEGFRMLVVLNGQGHQHSFAVAPGHDWYEPTQWQQDEHIFGQYDLKLPQELPEGQYDLGFLLLDEKSGRVLTAIVEGEEDVEPRFGEGEFFFEGALEIVTPAAAEQAAEADRDRSSSLAKAGSCEEAWQAWKEATWHVLNRPRYANNGVQTAEREVALCHVTRSETVTGEESRIAELLLARRYHHRLPELVDASRPLAGELDLRGDAAWEQERYEDAYRAWTTALRLDPRLSFTRRKAEEARDLRLDIVAKERDSERRRRDREQRQADQQERRDARRKAKGSMSVQPGPREMPTLEVLGLGDNTPVLPVTPPETPSSPDLERPPPALSPIPPEERARETEAAP